MFGPGRKFVPDYTGPFVTSSQAQLTFGTWQFSVHDFMRRGYGVVVQSNRGRAPCV